MAEADSSSLKSKWRFDSLKSLKTLLNLYMAKFEHHIFICANQRPPENPRGCCDPEGLGGLQLLFKQELAARGLKASVRANRAGCLDQCEHGPTVVVYPEGVWYGAVRDRKSVV